MGGRTGAEAACLYIAQGRSGCSRRCSPGWTVTSAAEWSSCQPHTLEPAADGHLWNERATQDPDTTSASCKSLLLSFPPPHPPQHRWVLLCLLALFSGPARAGPSCFSSPLSAGRPREQKRKIGTAVTAVLRLPATCCKEALSKRSISAAVPRQNASRPGYLRVLPQHPSPAFAAQLCNETSLKYSQAMLRCRKMPAWPTAALPGQS